MTDEQLDLILFAQIKAFEIDWVECNKEFVALLKYVDGLQSGVGPTPSEAVADLYRKVKGE